MKDNEWELVWEDEFATAGSPDPEKWAFEISGPLKTEAFELFHNYTATRTENSRCVNSCLVIEARKENYNGSQFTSASLFSRSAWKYVRIEVKAKLPYGTGIWPAIWMLPEGSDGEGWPSCGEIDIAEHVGQKANEVFFNVNTGAYNIVNGKAKGRHFYCEDLYTRFHIFRIDWMEESIQFFMNDELKFEFKKESNDPEVWPFDKPFYLKLMLAVGLLYDYGDGIKEVDTTVFPQQLLIDYVRVYKPAEMTQCSRNSWNIKASPEQVYKAFIDPKALEAWQAPGDMSARIHNFDLEVGYQMSLIYPETETDIKGKTTAREDRYSARFIELNTKPQDC